MLHTIKENIEPIYDHFQGLTVSCSLANIFFAGFKREVRWLPAFVGAAAFALSSSFSCYIAEDLTLMFVPSALKKDPHNYYKDHPYLHGVYFIYFLSMTLIGSAFLTKGTLFCLGRSMSLKTTFSLMTFDLFPLAYQGVFGSSFPSWKFYS